MWFNGWSLDGHDLVLRRYSATRSAPGRFRIVYDHYKYPATDLLESASVVYTVEGTAIPCTRQMAS